MAIDMVEDDAGNSFHAGQVIKVIGVGGGGGNAVAHMIRSDVRGIDFVFANTDSQDLVRRKIAQPFNWVPVVKVRAANLMLGAN